MKISHKIKLFYLFIHFFIFLFFLTELKKLFGQEMQQKMAIRFEGKLSTCISFTTQ